jgi:hypothetical protein
MPGICAPCHNDFAITPVPQNEQTYECQNVSKPILLYTDPLTCLLCHPRSNTTEILICLTTPSQVTCVTQLSHVICPIMLSHAMSHVMSHIVVCLTSSVSQHHLSLNAVSHQLSHNAACFTTLPVSHRHLSYNAVCLTLLKCSTV